MASNTNKKDGNSFEAELCDTLSKMGFWAHNMAQTQTGQPADILAVIDKKAFLIDCKLCSSKGFALSRVEPNQETAMDYWWKCGNGFGWFAVKCLDKIVMISKYEIDQLKRAGINFLTPDMISDYGTSLDLWRTAVTWK